MTPQTLVRNGGWRGLWFSPTAHHCFPLPAGDTFLPSSTRPALWSHFQAFPNNVYTCNFKKERRTLWWALMFSLKQPFNPKCTTAKDTKRNNTLHEPEKAEKTILTLVRLQALKIITRSDWNLLFSLVLKRLIMVHNALLSFLIIKRIHFK